MSELFEDDVRQRIADIHGRLLKLEVERDAGQYRLTKLENPPLKSDRDKIIALRFGIQLTILNMMDRDTMTLSLQHILDQTK